MLLKRTAMFALGALTMSCASQNSSTEKEQSSFGAGTIISASQQSSKESPNQASIENQHSTESQTHEKDIPTASELIESKTQHTDYVYFDLPERNRLKRPQPTLQQASQSLGISIAELRSNIPHIKASVWNQIKPREQCRNAAPAMQNLCELLTSHFEQKGRPNIHDSGTARRKAPIQPRHFATQQGMDYERLRDSFRDVPRSRIMAWVPAMLEHKGCPRNLSAASLRYVESGLPDPKARNALLKLYAHASPCLKPQDPGYETIHFRMALLQRTWGLPREALASIRLAMLAHRKEEPFRVLYWAGIVETSPSLKQRYWLQLIRDYPMSLHALKVWRTWGIDPYIEFARRPAVDLKVSEAIAPSLRLQIAWIDTLSALGEHSTAQRLIQSFLNKHENAIDHGTALYLVGLKARNGSELNTMTFLTHQANLNPRILNQQTLQIIFPMQYHELFEKNSPLTDTHLLIGLTKQESGFNPSARSPANARGLMQILPSTAEVVTRTKRNNLYSPATNVEIGGRYLAQLIDRFESVELALAAYNAGPNRIQDWKNRYRTNDLPLLLDIIPFDETRGYVSRVLMNNYWYSRLYTNPSDWKEQRVQKSLLVTEMIQGHTKKSPRIALVKEQETSVRTR